MPARSATEQGRGRSAGRASGPRPGSRGHVLSGSARMATRQAQKAVDRCQQLEWGRADSKVAQGSWRVTARARSRCLCDRTRLSGLSEVRTKKGEFYCM